VTVSSARGLGENIANMASKGSGDERPPQHGKTPRNNQAQNKQFNGAVQTIEQQIGRQLDMYERRMLHDSISGEGYGFQEIVDEGINLFGQ
jgi:hypothetical protein